jgi:AmiR/NasT family two-component response regulator
MERYRLDEGSAFQYLVRTSSTTNTKLRQVAQALVDSTNRRE